MSYTACFNNFTLTLAMISLLSEISNGMNKYKYSIWKLFLNFVS